MSGLVVIGASYAGIQAALAAREGGYAESVTIVSDETWLPYEKPPLSKEFLLGRASEQSLILRDNAFFAKNRIEFILSHHAVGIDLHARRVALESDADLHFDQLVVAAGSRARRLDVPGGDLDGVCYLRSLNDAIDLRMRLGEASEIAIVGGGFIGLEVASSTVRLGKKVTVVETASRLLERAVCPLVSQFLLNAHVKAGVDVRLGETVASFAGRAGQVVAVILSSGVALRADLVLVGIGGIANSELAAAAGLNCANGIMVDGQGRTEAKGVFAAGDCTNQYSRIAGRRIRLESVQNAQDQGKAVGLAVAGGRGACDSVPRFWSDQYDIKLQTVGISADCDHMVLRGSVKEGKFSVFHYRRGRLIAVDGINSPSEQMVVRRLIAVGLSPSPEQAADTSFELKSLLKATEKVQA